MDSLHVVHEVGQLVDHYVAVDVRKHAVIMALLTCSRQQSLPHLEGVVC